MNLDIFLWLVQDGITNGAIYALLALALLLVFAVTRVIFVPQGEYISYAALSFALLQAGTVPGTVYVLVGGGLIAAAFDIAVAVREHDKLVGAFAEPDVVAGSWERLETWSVLVAAELGLGP